MRVPAAGIVAGRAEADRLQGGLVVGEGSDARKRQDSGAGVVAGRGDAARQRAGNRQQVAGLRVRQRDGRRSQLRAVRIGDRRVDVGDRHRRPAFGECGAEARSETVELSASRSTTGARSLTSVTSMIDCAGLLLAVPSFTTTSMMRVSLEGVPVLSNVICCSAAW